MRSILLVGTILVLSSGCGDDSSSDSGTDAGPGPDANPADVSLGDTDDDARLADAGAGTEITIRAYAQGFGSLEGLNVYTGTTLSGVTDAAGEATVTFTPGSAVTVEYVGTEQTTYTSLVSIDETLGDVGDVFPLPMLIPPADQDLVTLTGTITNAPEATTFYLLGAVALNSVSNLANGSADPAFEVMLPRQAGEVNLQMGTLEATPDPRPSPRGFDRVISPMGAITAVDASADQNDIVVDVAVDGVMLVERSGSFTVPAGDPFFDTADGNVVFVRRSSRISLGATTRIYFDDSDGFQWEALRFPIEPVETQFALNQGPRFSFVYRNGDATGPQGEIPFLPPPNVTSPALGDTVSPGGQIAMDNVPAGANVSLFLNNGDDALWFIFSGNESVITIPTLPAGGEQVLVGDNVRFRPRFCTLREGSREECERASFSGAVDAVP